tara:strand:+ start:92 stop:874 length:783 start_codon:yes stop_codon:yes gene_type:complete
MDKKKRYLNYIVKQYHTDPNIQLLYRNLTTDELIEDTEIKCGITTIDSDSTDVGRFVELGRTKAPIGCIPVFVYEAPNKKTMWAVENGVKILCDNLRCKSNGLTEYYTLSVEAARKFYESQGLVDVSSEFIDESFDDVGAKQVRKDVKGCKEMEEAWAHTGLFTNYGSKYVSYNNIDSIPGLNNVSFHPLRKTAYINYYHAGKLDGNEEFMDTMITLTDELGIEAPTFNKGGCRLNQKSVDDALEIFKTLKSQNFVPKTV